METSSEWLTISEAAALVGCTRPNIHARIKSKSFQAHVVQVGEANFQWRIYRPSFEKWMEERVENARRGKKRPSNETPGRQRLVAAHACSDWERTS